MNKIFKPFANRGQHFVNLWEVANTILLLAYEKRGSQFDVYTIFFL